MNVEFSDVTYCVNSGKGECCQRLLAHGPRLLLCSMLKRLVTLNVRQQSFYRSIVVHDLTDLSGRVSHVSRV